MPNAALYRYREQRGLCPECGGPRDSGWFLCAPCRAYSRHAVATFLEKRRLAPGPNRIACCGHWHTLASVPCRLPCCGRVLALVEEAAS
jgi:hypothetical protein